MKKIYFFLMAMMVAFAANAWTVKFTNPQNWDDVYVYVYGGAGEVCGAWPGAAMTNSGDVWTYASEEGVPANIIFTAGKEGPQTGNLVFRDGATYNMIGEEGAEVKNYLAYFKNEANWSKVYVYTWGPSSFGGWPGTELTAGEDGLYTITVEGTTEPSFDGIKFTDNAGNETDNFKWETGKVYTNGNGGDEPTPPTPGSYPETLYIIGAGVGANGWLGGDEKAMTTVSEGVYELTLDLLADNIRFMGAEAVAAKNWDTTDQWGSAQYDGNNNPAVDGVNTLVQGKGNFTIAAAGKYTVKVDLANMTMTLTPDGEIVPPVPGDLPENVYLVGELVDAPTWGLAENYKMTKVDNVYTIDCVCPTGQWKIWNGVVLGDGSWEWSFGAGANGVITNSDPMEVWFNSPANFSTHPNDGSELGGKQVHITLTVPEGAAVKGSAVPAILTVTEDTSAVEEVEVAEGEAVYFNLQGQKVANPENGIYVKVVNGKATKVVVK